MGVDQPDLFAGGADVFPCPACEDPESIGELCPTCVYEDPERTELRDELVDGWWRFSVIGKPIAKQRAKPDFVRRRMYTPKQTTDYEKIVGELGILRRPRGWPLDALYAVELDVYCKNLTHLVDADNMKTIGDGLQGIAWKNDKQIRDYHCRTHVYSGPSATVEGITAARVDIAIRILDFGRG